MRKTVTVIDYGTGNVLSVLRAFERLGAAPVLTGTPQRARRAEYLVLPGVGAFPDGMMALEKEGLADSLREYLLTERPFLGICLGMQLIFEGSDEFGETKGLGVLPGRVVAIPRSDPDGRQRKTPHVGWNGLEPAGGRPWKDTVLDGLDPGEAVYFVHSYMAAPDGKDCLLADCGYDGVRITAAVQRGQVAGCQFHPEKSGPTGLKVMANFLRM